MVGGLSAAVYPLVYYYRTVVKPRGVHVWARVRSCGWCGRGRAGTSVVTHTLPSPSSSGADLSTPPPAPLQQQSLPEHHHHHGTLYLPAHYRVRGASASDASGDGSPAAVHGCVCGRCTSGRVACSSSSSNSSSDSHRAGGDLRRSHSNTSLSGSAGSGGVVKGSSRRLDLSSSGSKGRGRGGRDEWLRWLFPIAVVTVSEVTVLVAMVVVWYNYLSPEGSVSTWHWMFVLALPQVRWCFSLFPPFRRCRCRRHHVVVCSSCGLMAYPRDSVRVL